MRVRVQIAVIHKGKIVNQILDREIRSGERLKDLFKGLDKSGLGEGRLFKDLLRAPAPPAVLVNGNRIEIPKGLKTRLEENDEVSVVSAFSGG